MKDRGFDDLWTDDADDLDRARPERARHVGCPLAFLADVCRLTEGRTALVVALLVYRRVHVCRSQTVTLPIEELRKLGIDRRRRREGLIKLQAAGLIRIKKASAGRSAKVRLTWRLR